MRSTHSAIYLILLFSFQTVVAQINDAAYGDKIKTYTTDERFLSDLVDHLPISETVPSPLEHFGDIIGAPNILHNTAEIHGYLRLLAEHSPRVAVRTIGQTEEGREMIEVVIADEQTITDLETYRGYLNRLADPRTLTEAEAYDIIPRAKPIYYTMTGLHSTETGGPEMFMELAYRLAVGESDMIQAIRAKVIVILVPVAEPDGRDRMVDIYNYRKQHNDIGPDLVYWGKYVAHDNNRDGYGLSLALTRNILASFLYWKPIVGHDLHESVPYLYVSTGTGPYNEYIDPLTIDEWHNLAHEEVTELTKRGMPGVWTHGYYTGWASNYLLWIPNLRNAIGRFYETFGNAIADTRERKLQDSQTSREWYRPNPPLEKTDWSLRNNVNYSQSGLLIALKYVADNGTDLVENFYLKSRNAVNKGRQEPPHAWVIRHDQPRSHAAAGLVNLLMDEGAEVHQATQDLKWTEEISARGDKGKGEKQSSEKAKVTRTAPKGSYVVRLDQPYRALILNLLGEQDFPKDAPPPYDDTGWTLPYLWQVQARRVDDPSILQAGMKPLKSHIEPAGGLQGRGHQFFLVNNTTEDNLTVFRFQLADVKMEGAESAFEVDKSRFNAGSLIIPAKGNPGDLAQRIDATARDLGLTVNGTAKKPAVSTHNVETPRVALVHTWVSTPQDAGWWRLAFDKLGIPYAHLSEQDIATLDPSSLDVIIVPRTWASPQTLVAGTTTAGDPIPWQESDLTSHLGKIDQTDDVRRGMGYEGLINLKTFIENGGVLITEGSIAAFPIEMALTRRISITPTKNLAARGCVVKAEVKDKTSPITYGYSDTLAVYFSQAPVFKISKQMRDFRLPDWLKDEIWEKEVPREVVNFAKKGLLMSGMLRGEEELAGTPAVVDVPVGKGHVVLFANRPFWRGETCGSHALVFNTLLHWNDLRLGWPKRPEEEEEEEQDLFRH
ncbi:MAG: M14 family zinc carboxypeptidase [Candidatus Neomarinimicrobiota bacterium]